MKCKECGAKLALSKNSKINKIKPFNFYFCQNKECTEVGFYQIIQRGDNIKKA